MLKNLFSFSNGTETKNEKRNTSLLVLTVIYVSVYLINAVFMVKILNLGQIGNFPIVQTGDFVFFIVGYILSDVFSEVFGYNESRRSAFLAAIIAISIGLIGKGVTYLPFPDYAQSNQDAFQFIYGGNYYVTIMGTIIFYVGDLLNDVVFRKIKKVQKGHQSYFSFTIRSTVSSWAGRALDAGLFAILVMIPFNTPWIANLLGFEVWGMAPIDILSNFIMTMVFQIVIELIFTPLSHLVSKRVKKYIGESKLYYEKQE